VHFLIVVASGLTNVGVTRCGNWWCHPIFSPKSDHLFQSSSSKVTTFCTHRHYFLPPRLRLPADRLFVCSLYRKKIRFLLGCHPLDVVNRGGPPPPLVIACLVASTSGIHCSERLVFQWPIIVEWDDSLYSLICFGKNCDLVPPRPSPRADNITEYVLNAQKWTHNTCRCRRLLTTREAAWY